MIALHKSATAYPVAKHFRHSFMSREHILIVEDERAVARSLQYALEQEGYSVSWADTGQRALECVAAHEPGLILLDIRLPDMSGFDVCKRIRAAGKRQPILILTARDETLDKVLGLELGADDYVVKPYELRELIARIRALLRRAYGELSESSEGEKVILGDIEIDLDQLRVLKSGEQVYLTPTEFRILRYLAGRPNRPVTREQLIEAVWGYNPSLGGDRTVDVHIHHLRQKLESDPDNPRWIQTVRGVGYVLKREK